MTARFVYLAGATQTLHLSDSKVAVLEAQIDPEEQLVLLAVRTIQPVVHPVMKELQHLEGWILHQIQPPQKMWVILEEQ